MASYNIDNATFSSQVRELQPSDWNHAAIFNQTLQQIVENEIALQKAVFYLRNLTIKPAYWKKDAKGYRYRLDDYRITRDTIVNVYFANESIDTARECSVEGETDIGSLVLHCNSIPKESLSILAIEFRNEVIDSAG